MFSINESLQLRASAVVTTFSVVVLTCSQLSCAISPSSPHVIISDPIQYELKVLGKPPRRCLALSGGGIRSALFSIGVIDALAENDQLLNFDVISSVSGGGYASGWLLTELHRLASLNVARCFYG